MKNTSPCIESLIFQYHAVTEPYSCPFLQVLPSKAFFLVTADVFETGVVLPQRVSNIIGLLRSTLSLSSVVNPGVGPGFHMRVSILAQPAYRPPFPRRPRSNILNFPISRLLTNTDSYLNGAYKRIITSFEVPSVIIAIGSLVGFSLELQML